MDEPSKRCCTCQAIRPLSDVNRRAAATDGYQARCRGCSRSWYERNRIEHMANVRARNDRARRECQIRLAEYLAEHPCVDCGEQAVRCLEFDHRDPTTKRADISKLISNAISWPKVLTEIQKCDVRCANCHRRITVQRGGWWRQAVYEAARDARAARRTPGSSACSHPAEGQGS